MPAKSNSGAVTQGADELTNQPNLEEAFARLEEIIGRMEQGNLPLEQLLKEYEEGARLVALCQQRLRSAEQRIQIVTQTLDGSIGLADFEPSAENAQ